MGRQGRREVPRTTSEHTRCGARSRGTTLHRPGKHTKQHCSPSKDHSPPSASLAQCHFHFHACSFTDDRTEAAASHIHATTRAISAQEPKRVTFRTINSRRSCDSLSAPNWLTRPCSPSVPMPSSPPRPPRPAPPKLLLLLLPPPPRPPPLPKKSSASRQDSTRSVSLRSSRSKPAGDRLGR